MTSNQQRAAELIGKVMSRWDMDGRPDVPGGIDAHLAQALAADGLITPDLPEPSENSAGEAAISGDGFYLEISGNEAVINDTIGFCQEYLTDLALALLAAADHMEENSE